MLAGLSAHWAHAGRVCVWATSGPRFRAISAHTQFGRQARPGQPPPSRSPFADRRCRAPQPPFAGFQAPGQPAVDSQRSAQAPAATGGRSARGTAKPWPMQGTPSPARPLLAAAVSSPEMEIPLAEGRFVQPQQAAAALPPAAATAAGGPFNGSSPSRHSETMSTDAGEYSEHARLVSSALSDDGMTPLIQVCNVHRWWVLPCADLAMPVLNCPSGLAALHCRRSTLCTALCPPRSQRARVSRTCCCSASA